MSMCVRYTQPKGLKAQFEIIHYGEGQIHMKCPICGQELRPGKKDPNYLLCYNCKKKFKIPQSAHKVQKRAEKPEPEEQKYSNIPPKEVREKREQEMRDAYDELLAVGDGRKKKKPTPKRTKITKIIIPIIICFLVMIISFLSFFELLGVSA